MKRREILAAGTGSLHISFGRFGKALTESQIFRRVRSRWFSPAKRGDDSGEEGVRKSLLPIGAGDEGAVVRGAEDAHLDEDDRHFRTNRAGKSALSRANSGLSVG